MEMARRSMAFTYQTHQNACYLGYITRRSASSDAILFIVFREVFRRVLRAARAAGAYYFLFHPSWPWTCWAGSTRTASACGRCTCWQRPVRPGPDSFGRAGPLCSGARPIRRCWPHDGICRGQRLYRGHRKPHSKTPCQTRASPPAWRSFMSFYCWGRPARCSSHPVHRPFSAGRFVGFCRYAGRGAHLGLFTVRPGAPDAAYSQDTASPWAGFSPPGPCAWPSSSWSAPGRADVA
jgi:hypothetical protein